MGRRQMAVHPVHGYAVKPQEDLKTIKRNKRERVRVETVNRGFENLRAQIPGARVQKTSKAAILGQAVDYIQYLHSLLQPGYREVEEGYYSDSQSSPNYPQYQPYPQAFSPEQPNSCQYSPGKFSPAQDSLGQFSPVAQYTSPFSPATAQNGQIYFSPVEQLSPGKPSPALLSPCQASPAMQSPCQASPAQYEELEAAVGWREEEEVTDSIVRWQET